MSTEWTLDLLTGRMSVPTPAEKEHEERMTALTKQRLGECEYACRFAEPFGWVPEAGCPVHDGE